MYALKVSLIFLKYFFFKDQKLNKLHNCSISLCALLMFTCRWQYNLKLI